MHSVMQQDSLSLSLCWHSCAQLSLFFFLPPNNFFKLLLAAPQDFTKDRRAFVSGLRMTQMHMNKGVGGDNLQRSFQPQPLSDLLLEKDARGRAAKNGKPSSV